MARPKTYTREKDALSAIKLKEEISGGKWEMFAVEGGFQVRRLDTQSIPVPTCDIEKPVTREEEIMETTETPIIPTPKKKGNKPVWREVDMLHIPDSYRNKYPDRVYRAVNMNKPGRVSQMVSLGWQVDNELGTYMASRGNVTAEYGAPVDSTYRVADLIYMWLPKDMSEARREYYADKTRLQTASMHSDLNSSVDGATVRSEENVDIGVKI